MSNPWDAEFPLDPAHVPALIEAQFPELAPVTADVFGHGWDNVVYRVNHDWLFRFPKRTEALELVDLECRALPALHQLLPLPVPNPQFIGKPTEPFPYPFFGYRMLVGDTACTRCLNDADRLRIAPQLGRFLAALHGLGPQLAHVDIPPDQYERTSFQRQVARIQKNLEQLEGLYSNQDLKAARALIQDPQPFEIKTGVPVHGDLYVRHLLLDPAGDITAVIDWGDFHLGDPLVDLTTAWTLFNKTARDSFFNAYGSSLKPERVQITRVRALGYAVVLSNYARDLKDQLLLEESMKILSNVLDH